MGSESNRGVSRRKALKATGSVVAGGVIATSGAAAASDCGGNYTVGPDGGDRVSPTQERNYAGDPNHDCYVDEASDPSPEDKGCIYDCCSDANDVFYLVDWEDLGEDRWMEQSYIEKVGTCDQQ